MKQLEDYYQGQSPHYSLKFENCDTYVKAQPDLLFTLLRNLIDNAIKASEIDQPIIITTDIKDQHVIISVKDQGIGMSEEDVKKATDAFYMADKSRSRSMGGAGLGLTIVKRICDAHHTKLFIQSKLKQGTTVSFELEVANHE